MEKEDDNNKTKEPLNGFSPVSSTRIFWKSRKRSASGRNLDKVTEDNVNETPNKQEESSNDEKMQDQNLTPELSERRKALFEPLEPVTNINGKRSSAESLLPPPDFDAASYPKGSYASLTQQHVQIELALDDSCRTEKLMA